MATAKVNLKLDNVKQSIITAGSAMSAADVTCEKVWEYCKKMKMHHTALLASWFSLPMREDALGKGKPVGCQALIASGKRELVAIGHFSQHMSVWVSTKIEDADKAFAYAKRAKGAGRKVKKEKVKAPITSPGLSEEGAEALASLKKGKKKDGYVNVKGISVEEAIMLLEEQAKLNKDQTALALLVSLRAFMLK